MNERYYRLPERLVQVIGIACTPAHDLPPEAGPAARLPVVAAIVTLRQRDDGHVEIMAERMSDVRATEFPLPHLIEQALAPGALTVISPADRATLGIDAANRRYFLEPKLAAVVRGQRTLDPIELLPGGNVDEHQLCRRLSIPVDDGSDTMTELLCYRETTHLIEERALARAVSRLMLWSTATAFTSAEPGRFFEPMLALHPWLQDLADTAPIVTRWAHAKPVMRAVSFANQYRENLARRLAGEDVAWTEFRDGLFHT